jgi:hypothetical protein
LIQRQQDRRRWWGSAVLRERVGVRMNDYQPGYPVDSRSHAMRERAARGHLGDFEWAAARVIARLTGERVVIQDDNHARSMTDIRIDYRDRPPGYAEVITDLDREYSAMVRAVRDHHVVPTPGLGRVWWVTVSARARLRTLVATANSRYGYVHIRLVSRRSPSTTRTCTHSGPQVRTGLNMAEAARRFPPLSGRWGWGRVRRPVRQHWTTPTGWVPFVCAWVCVGPPNRRRS